MNDYIFFMHAVNSEAPRDRGDEWTGYLARLRQLGAFEGGSAIGDGVCVSKSASPSPDITRHLSGYLRIQAESLSHARNLMIGNPVFEAGGIVEIRELPKR